MTKEENHVSPRMWANLAGECGRGRCPRPSSVCEEASPGTQRCFSDGSSAARQGPPSDMSIRIVTLQDRVFRKSTSANYTSDFYPRIVIKNMFTDLIICIFSFRVNPLKGSLIPCSTVLTKCFHIFFQLDSLFHFWKILCNYFLMQRKPHKVPVPWLLQLCAPRSSFIPFFFSFYLIN